MGLVLDSDGHIKLKCDGQGFRVVLTLNVRSVPEALREAEKLGWEIDPITVDGHDHLIYCPKCKQMRAEKVEG
ncbi:MAG: hypothetical protein WC517_01790 [Patescibacteria group bacterium]